MIKRPFRSRRRGSLIPLLAVSVISLFAFVALAVDLGMLAVSRTHCQNAADASALAGCRTLNNKTGSVNSNLAQAVAVSKATVTDNAHLSAQFVDAQIQKVETGQYLYDPTASRFRVATWTDVTSGQSAAPPFGSWTGIRMTLSVSQPTYFMRVFGVTSMPMGAVASAVYRPRDVAFALDMTGSMAYASQFNFNGRSMNPDTLVPTFGHYGLVTSNIVATANQANGSGEAISANNYTVTSSGGPAIVRDFYFDPVNVADPSIPAYPVTSTTANLKNAFHRWSPGESGGDPLAAVPVPVTYGFAGYNAFHNGTETNPAGPTPAPTSFQTMTDDAGLSITYVGDRWRRADGSMNKTDATWATGAPATRAAATALELLGYTVNASAPPNVLSTNGTAITTNPTVLQFRDPCWEAFGYDLDIAKYRTERGVTGGPMTVATFVGNNGNDTQQIQVPSADRFKGYSMGPGYWGKTFFVWPPDPRFEATANVTSPDPDKPGFDTSGRAMCDWRRHFFLTSGGSAFGSTTNINASLLRTSGTGVTLASSNFTVNYAAILKWIKTGPQVMTPNLRAGRVLYYSSIPDDVNTGTGTAQQVLDKVFWKNYIDYVLGTGGFNQSTNLYGYGDSPTGFARTVNTSALTNWQGPDGTWSAVTPRMVYTDSPLRPRLHFWFGPLTMMDFIASGVANKTGGYVNWTPGTAHEAQSWQLKAGMNSVLTDIKGNHPNDLVGMTMFAYNTNAPPAIYKNPRVPTGQDFPALKNALFYPRSLLPLINAGDTTTELRPYDTSFNSVAPDEIPNANGGTDPNTGLAVAFNLLSPSSNLPTVYGTIRGRRGASKVVIFETDGVPNCHSNYTLNLQGYNTYYSNLANGNYDGNGDTGATNPAIAVATQMSKQLATTTSGDSGLSLPNSPARVYPIAFGDLFDPVAAPNATFRTAALQFMANVAAAGGTGVSGATTLPEIQIITGTYEQRITRLRDCLESIFQSGVSVSLIE